MSLVESPIHLSKRDGDHLVAWHYEPLKINNISWSEGILSALEHFFRNIRVNRHSKLILSIVVIDIESIDESLQLNSRLGLSIFRIRADNTVP